MALIGICGMKPGMNKKPLFPIGVVAGMLKVATATLRIWERKGLIRPRRLGKNRYYSYHDLDRLQRIKHLLREKGMNLAGAKGLLSRSLCWELKKCGPEKFSCPVYTADNRKRRPARGI